MGGDHTSYASAVSSDGNVIVGSGKSANGQEAFRWTSGSGMIGLGDLPGGSFFSTASGVSSDGNVIVGYGNSVNNQEAFRWTSGNGMVGLGDLSGGSFTSSALASSSDGNVIVGYGSSANGAEAFRWTSGSGMIGLGVLPAGGFFSSALAISGDGSVIVGSSLPTSGSGPTACFWNSTGEIQNLKDYLIANGVTDLTGWTLSEATDISADGNVIVGYGARPNGSRVAWRATISSGPEPGTLVFLVLGLIGYRMVRRRPLCD